MSNQLSVPELLSEQFYEWELRGRGWALWPVPVDLEPPFRPFVGHRVPRSRVLDDGQFETPLSSLADSFLRMFRQKPPPSIPEESEEPEPTFVDPSRDLVELHIVLPRDGDAETDVFEQCLFSLGYCKHALSFEVIGTGKEIVSQIVAQRCDSQSVASQIKAHFPDAVVAPAPETVREKWLRRESGYAVVLEFGLAKEFMIPLRTTREMATDPLVGLFGALERLDQNEIGIFQVLFQPVRHPWGESIVRAVTTSNGEPFFENAPEVLTLAKHKLRRPLFAAAVRVASCSPSERRAWNIVKDMGGALRQFGSPETNELIPLESDDREFSHSVAELLERTSRRSGMILNSEELASVAHLPSASVRSKKLKREARRSKEAPDLATGSGIVLGTNIHEGETLTVTLKPHQRTRHMHLIGTSGTGKSTLLLNLITQDIQNGAGLAVLDPHGDLIEKIIGLIPEKRLDDVILLDPGDPEYSIGFNILSAHSDIEKNLISSDLVAVFRRLSTSWGDQMTSVLGNAILAFLESSEGGTLADLRRFLVEPAFRAKFLRTVRDPEIVYYWTKEFPLLTGRPQAPLLTRLDTFLRPKPIRYMVSQKENRLDFAEIMNGGKILLAKLSQGDIGEENAYLLGTLLVSKLHQMAIGRQSIKEELRRDFWLYIDECHNFITPSMAAILTGVRKYHVGLILAHQELRQLQRDPEVSSAVLSNPYTRVCFRVGDDDARKLSDGFSFFEAADLQSLGIGEAICRIERADFDFNLSIPPLVPPNDALAERMRQEILARTRKKYGTPRIEIEARSAAAHAEPPTSDPATVKGAGAPDPPRPAPPRNPTSSDQPPPPQGPGPANQPIKRSPKTPADIPPLGRGGARHKYLQHLVKEMAVGMGFEVEVERQTDDRAGSIDVHLCKGTRRIAFEISVTTTPEHEVQNFRKCIKAGYDQVVILCADKAHLSKVEEAIRGALAKDELDRVQVAGPDDIGTILLQLAAESAGNEGVSHGKKTKVTFKTMSEAETKKRREMLASITARSLNRLKGEKGC